MKAREGVSKLSLLALQRRREGLAKLLPPVAETLRGSLIERYLTCGNARCKCARGERHGPVWYLSVTLGPGRTTGTIVPLHLVEQVRRWIDNYHRVKEQLERISDINRELLRWERRKRRANWGNGPAILVCPVYYSYNNERHGAFAAFLFGLSQQGLRPPRARRPDAG